MRAIVFRAKDDAGRWRRGFILPFADNIGLLYERDLDDPTTCGVIGHYVDQETVGQYTGIADSQANPIFEGDILETEKYGVVEVIFANAMFETRYFLKDGNEHRIPFAAVGTMTVIGNIHDNPELMKGGEK